MASLIARIHKSTCHAWASRKCGDDWYEFNDARVTKIELE